MRMCPMQSATAVSVQQVNKMNDKVCNCEKMKKLMESDSFASKGIIECCPYCGKINPMYYAETFKRKVELLTNNIESMGNTLIGNMGKCMDSIAQNFNVTTPVSTVDNDPVNQPNHYCKGGYELGPILYAWGLSHRRASAVEYIMRAGDKDASKEVEDLRKAIRNLEMEIEYMAKYGKVRQ